MTIPITICDDSRFARHQVERALMPGWDVNVHFAENGLEALEAIRNGKAEILFLDLTMPVMDGIEVLRTAQQEKLQTKIFVISADIQPIIIDQAKTLGALEFLKKPIDQETLSSALDRIGINTSGTANRALTNQEVDLSDWIRELFNVAMGKAAKRLSQTLNTEINLNIPMVNEIEPGDISMAIAASRGNEDATVITQGFIGGGIFGECLLVLNQINNRQLFKLLHLSEESPEIELIMDLSGILNGTLIQNFFHGLDKRFNISQPVLLHASDKLNLLGHQAEKRSAQYLAVEVLYQISTYNIDCTQLIIFTPDSRKALHELSSFYTE